MKKNFTIENSSNIENKVMAMPERKLWQLRWLLGIATVLFILGVYLPMFTIKTFIIFENSVSIISGTIKLFADGQFLLFLVVFGFSIVLPTMKIYVIFRLLASNAFNNQRQRRYLELIHKYGRWSMLDVMVVAILVVTVKLGAVASVQVHSGLFIFGLAVILIMYITNAIVKAIKSSF